jgi:hypothetical protein
MRPENICILLTCFYCRIERYSLYTPSSAPHMSVRGTTESTYPSGFNPAMSNSTTPAECHLPRGFQPHSFPYGPMMNTIYNDANGVMGSHGVMLQLQPGVPVTSCQNLPRPRTSVGTSGTSAASVVGATNLPEQKIFPGLMHERARRGSMRAESPAESSTEEKYGDSRSDGDFEVHRLSAQDAYLGAINT